jgi:hypothetical protein
MNLSIKEINELIYSLGITAHNGNFCNREVNESLLERLYDELNSKIAEEAIDEEVEDWITQLASDSSHMLTGFPMVNPFTSESEVDEDLKYSLPNFKHTPPAPKKIGEGTAQSVLDYVESMGSVTHKEMQDYYKSLNGSNTFAYCLKNLIIPYKNRKTQRYLIKNDIGKYEVRLANPSNWIVIEY